MPANIAGMNCFIEVEKSVLVKEKSPLLLGKTP